MKYRVKIDMSFDNEANATALMDFSKSLVGNAVSVNDEHSSCEMELCRHDEGLPCTLLERVEKTQTEREVK